MYAIHGWYGFQFWGKKNIREFLDSDPRISRLSRHQTSDNSFWDILGGWFQKSLEMFSVCLILSIQMV